MLNSRCIRLLHRTLFSAQTPVHIQRCDEFCPIHLSWRWGEAKRSSSALVEPHPGVLSSSSSLETVLKLSCTHAATLQPFWAGMGHQYRFMAIRRKRKSSVQQKPVSQKLERSVDEQITAPTVRLVQGDSHVIISTAEAIQRARQQGLNLVQMDRKTEEPACRILDYRQLQEEFEEAAEKKATKAFDAVMQASKTKAVRIGWNIAPHDFAVKRRKVQEFLDKGKTVSVGVTYDHRPKTWQEQYPKAVEISKQLWEEFRQSPDVYTWFDYNESGNKQVSIVYSPQPPPASGKKTLLPWEPGSLLPPFLIQMQQEAEAGAKQASSS